MKSTNKFTLKYIMFILLTTALLITTATTYAWIRREWNPSIEDENLQIVTAGALGIKLDENASIDQVVSVNKYVDADSFVFRQVSNCSGRSDDFFALNYSDPGTIDFPTLNNLDVTNPKYSRDYKTMGKINGYIEFGFTLFGESRLAKKTIYLDENSLLRYNQEVSSSHLDPTNAIRISLTFSENTVNEKHYVFSKSGSHSGITNEKDEEGNFVAQDQSIKNPDSSFSSSLNKDFVSDDINKVAKFGADINNYYGQENPLITMNSGQSVAVKIKIWLEGTDPACNDDTSGKNFDLKLIFNSYDHD